MTMVSVLCPSCNKENSIDSGLEHFYCTHCGKKVMTEAAVAYSAVIQKKDTSSKKDEQSEEKSDSVVMATEDNKQIHEETEAAVDSHNDSINGMPDDTKSDSKNMPVALIAALVIFGVAALFGLVLPLMGLMMCSQGQITQGQVAQSGGPQASSQERIESSSVKMPDYLYGFWEIGRYVDSDGNNKPEVGRALLKDNEISLLVIRTGVEQVVKIIPVQESEGVIRCTTNSQTMPYATINTSIKLGETDVTADGDGILSITLTNAQEPSEATRYITLVLSKTEQEVTDETQKSLGFLVPEKNIGTYNVTYGGKNALQPEPMEGTVTIGEHSLYLTLQFNGEPIDLTGIAIGQTEGIDFGIDFRTQNTVFPLVVLSSLEGEIGSLMLVGADDTEERTFFIYFEKQ